MFSYYKSGAAEPANTCGQESLTQNKEATILISERDCGEFSDAQGILRLSVVAGGKPLDAVKVLRKYIQKPMKELLEAVRSGNTVMTFTRTRFSKDFFARSCAQDGEGDLDMLLDILIRLDQAGVGWLLASDGRSLTLADVQVWLERWAGSDEQNQQLQLVDRDEYARERKLPSEIVGQLPERLLGIADFGDLLRVVDEPAIYEFAKLWTRRLYDPMYMVYTPVCSAMSKVQCFLAALALREINAALMDFVNLFEGQPLMKRALYMAHPDGSEAALLQIEPELGYQLEDWVELYSQAPHLDVEPPEELLQWAQQPLTPPAELESFLRELFKKLVQSPLNNSRAFLWKKIVPGQVEFWKPAGDFTEEERLQVLGHQRMLRSTILREIFRLLEKRSFRIKIDGKDFLSICPNPAECLPGWLRYFA